MNERVLLLTPSRGLGGGVERYAQTLESAFAKQGVEYTRVDLHERERRARVSAHARVVARCRWHLKQSPAPTRLVIVHRALLPAASLLAREQSVSGISLVCHGTDVWGRKLRLRWYLERYLMRKPAVRVVCASSFTSGVLSCICKATVLPPGVSDEWYETLVNASNAAKPAAPGIHLVTAFRLSSWRDKGLPELLDAVAALGRPDIHVTVCGSGAPPPELQETLSGYANCILMPELTDCELAGQLASADLFVLATRTRPGRKASGEGFGLVLLEAQIAGTPVIGPAHGGSYDAYIEGVTGVSPTNESPEALARVIGELLRDPERLGQMSARATDWARAAFAPQHYASLAAARLL